MIKLSDEQRTIRRIERDDIDQLIEIADSLGLSRWTRYDYEEEIARNDSCLLVCSSGMAIHGFLVARVVPSATAWGGNDAEIYNLGVRTGHQGSGVGKGLLDSAVEWLLNQGVSIVWLEVRASNSRAISFYSRAGFTKEARRPNFYADPVEDAIIMSLNLKNSDAPIQ